MSCCASFDADQARLQFREECLDLSPPQFAAKNLCTLRVSAEGVKDVLSDIEADCDWLHHVTPPSYARKPYRSSRRVMDAVHSITSGRTDFTAKRPRWSDFVAEVGIEAPGEA